MTTSDPIDAMQTKIVKDAEEKAQKIISEAEKEADEMIKQVKSEMINVEETENKAIKERIQESKRKQLAEEKTEHLRRIQEYKTEIIESVYGKTLQRLKDYRETGQYKKKLMKLIIEAGVSIGGGELVVSVNDKDKQLVVPDFLKEAARNIEEKTNIETQIELSDETLNSLGGTIVSKSKESATVDNTFEERLNRKKEQISGELENILFR